METRPLTDAEKSWVNAHQRSKSRVLLVATAIVGLLAVLWPAARNAPEESDPTTAQRLDGRIDKQWRGTPKAPMLVVTVGGHRVLADHVPGLEDGEVAAVWVVEVGYGDRVVIAVDDGWSAV